MTEMTALLPHAYPCSISGQQSGGGGRWLAQPMSLEIFDQQSKPKELCASCLDFPICVCFLSPAVTLTSQGGSHIDQYIALTSLWLGNLAGEGCTVTLGLLRPVTGSQGSNKDNAGGGIKEGNRKGAKSRLSILDSVKWGGERAFARPSVT